MNKIKDFSELRKNLKKDFTGFKTIKIAILGDSATQFLTQAIRGTGYDRAYDLEIFEAEFNQVERQILDPASDLYKFKPEVIIIFRSSHKLLQKFNKLESKNYQALAENEIELIKELAETINNETSAKILYFNYNETDDSVFGNYSNKTSSSFIFQLRKLNYLLMDYASDSSIFNIIDISAIQNYIGKNNFFHSSIYINTDMVLSMEVLPIIASRVLDTISAFSGKFHKCIILDLDNTTWGGIIGDDGLENIQLGSLGIGKAFTEFQYWVKKLKNRGIIVAICSKNTESVAKEPFEKHPDMILRLDDISVFIANWENKADNIREIKEILNIGFDSMVFLDDNPFERNLVRENLPDVTVPELPEDPAEYLEYLYALNLFETVSFSSEDSDRTQLYKLEAERKSVREKFTNEDDYLNSLEMYSLVEPFNKFNTPRVAQLSQRSNQFNLRTVRYDENEINLLSNSNEYATFSFTLSDKYGDHGLICVLVVKKESDKVLFIENWFMSCRVLKRTMENFVLNTLMEYAQVNNYDTLRAEYIPTVKNEIVRLHYTDLGFTETDGIYYLDTESYTERKTFIKTK